jgi:hypothetical protein
MKGLLNGVFSNFNSPRWERRAIYQSFGLPHLCLSPANNARYARVPASSLRARFTGYNRGKCIEGPGNFTAMTRSGRLTPACVAATRVHPLPIGYR